jgi:hypothetical protein
VLEEIRLNWAKLRGSEELSRPLAPLVIVLDGGHNCQNVDHESIEGRWRIVEERGKGYEPSIHWGIQRIARKADLAAR